MITNAGELDWFLTVMAGAAADMASLSVVVGLLACTKSIQRLSGPPRSFPLLHADFYDYGFCTTDAMTLPP